MTSKKPESKHMQNARFLGKELPDLMLKAAQAFVAYQALPDTAEDKEAWAAVERANDEVYTAMRALRLNALREVMGEDGLVRPEDIVGLMP